MGTHDDFRALSLSTDSVEDVSNLAGFQDLRCSGRGSNGWFEVVGVRFRLFCQWFWQNGEILCMVKLRIKPKSSKLSDFGGFLRFWVCLCCGF